MGFLIIIMTVIIILFPRVLKRVQAALHYTRSQCLVSIQ